MHVGTIAGHTEIAVLEMVSRTRIPRASAHHIFRSRQRGNRARCRCNAGSIDQSRIFRCRRCFARFHPSRSRFRALSCERISDLKSDHVIESRALGGEGMVAASVDGTRGQAKKRMHIFTVPWSPALCFTARIGGCPKVITKPFVLEPLVESFGCNVAIPLVRSPSILGSSMETVSRGARQSVKALARILGADTRKVEAENRPNAFARLSLRSAHFKRSPGRPSLRRRSCSSVNWRSRGKSRFL